MSLSVGIVGGSGYTGGELLRLLHSHSAAHVTQVTSRSEVGNYVYQVHPTLRGAYDLTFIHPDALVACDVLFLCMPHGSSSKEIERYAALAPTIIDLSADFRLSDPAAYLRWYGESHPNTAWLEKFVYGLPEVQRDALRGAHYASGVGCNATVINLALLPLARAGLLQYVAAEVKVGSSEGGAGATDSSHHPIRSGAVRVFKAANHRHTAEVEMILQTSAKLHFTVTSVELVRGVHLTAHCTLTEPLEEKAVWKLYRQAYKGEPFIRLISQKTGLHRLPEPRLVAGTNLCDIGFVLDDADPTHLVVVAALDNLVKGAAGSAIQCMNVMLNFDETDGLRHIGVYP
jgi:N-acetyl-gamma-glutamyl-phosphate/LysW-gamma-L-alpha-aminoadipyl-6-phosphate reductase